MNTLSFLVALIAGGLGAGLRYAATVVLPPRKGRFPIAIFTVNVLGSFLAGMFTALLMKNSLNDDVYTILIIGFCSGFTTMSTFAVESIERLQDGHWWVAGLNILGTTTVGLSAAIFGFSFVGGL